MPAGNCVRAPAPTFLRGPDVRLLVTRPEVDAQRTTAALRERGHDVVVAPLLRIEAIDAADIGNGPWAAILVTSANAARAITAHPRLADLRILPVLAVGESSADAMRAAGFIDVISAAGAASDLVRLVAERFKPGTTLLYLAGADRAGDIAAELRGKNLIVRTAIVYRAVAAATLPPAAIAALAAGVDGVLHFSRRSAETYVDAARGAGTLVGALAPVHYCLSAQVAAPLAQAGAARVRIAAKPTESALLDLIAAP